MFSSLFSPLHIGACEIKNRPLFTGHDTSLPTDGTINDALLYGTDGRTIYMQHISNDEAMIFEDIDTLVLAQGHQSQRDLADKVAKEIPDLKMMEIGDCIAPRTAEEAVYEGLVAAWDL